MTEITSSINSRVTTRVPDVVFMNFTSGIFFSETLVSIKADTNDWANSLESWNPGTKDNTLILKKKKKSQKEHFIVKKKYLSAPPYWTLLILFALLMNNILKEETATTIRRQWNWKWLSQEIIDIDSNRFPFKTQKPKTDYAYQIDKDPNKGHLEMFLTCFKIIPPISHNVTSICN